MEFIFELILEIIGGIFETTYDLAASTENPKSKKWKVVSIIILTIGGLFYLFLIICFAMIIFNYSSDESKGYIIVLALVEILFIWFLISMIKKIRKELKTIKNKKTDMEKYMEDREESGENRYSIGNNGQFNTDNENCDKEVSDFNEEEYDNMYAGGSYDKNRKSIILNGKEYRER